jgi:hypothetical protein
MVHGILDIRFRIQKTVKIDDRRGTLKRVVMKVEKGVSAGKL